MASNWKIKGLLEEVGKLFIAIFSFGAFVRNMSFSQVWCGRSDWGHHLRWSQRWLLPALGTCLQQGTRLHLAAEDAACPCGHRQSAPVYSAWMCVDVLLVPSYWNPLKAWTSDSSFRNLWERILWQLDRTLHPGWCCDHHCGDRFLATMSYPALPETRHPVESGGILGSWKFCDPGRSCICSCRICVRVVTFGFARASLELQSADVYLEF